MEPAKPSARSARLLRGWSQVIWDRRTLVVVLGAAVAIWLGWRNVSREFEGVNIATTKVGSIPVSIFRPQASPALIDKKRPAVVIAHGFAGSQQLMQPLALTLARNGYISITFDFAGHGRNPDPMPGGVADLDRSTHALLEEINQMVAFARALPESDQRLALLGHSMASDLVVAYAMEHNDISATVALSLFGRDVSVTEPRNLIIIDGAWEASMLTDAARRIVDMASSGPALQRVTYGDFSKGTARRFVLAKGAEHIGVLYSRDALTETLGWIQSVFGVEDIARPERPIDRRGKWLALLFAGLVALAFPATQLLPALSEAPLGAGLAWRRLLPISVVPAILTPLLLWKAPTDFLPILLGDYLVVHFALYGLLTAIGLRLFRSDRDATISRAAVSAPLLVSVLAVAAYYILVLGLPIDSYVTSFMPTGWRWLLIPAMLVGASVYFLGDEWLVRGPRAVIGGYAFTKVCFLLSLGIAVALNPAKLFFLVIIAPVMLALFVIYGLVNRWVYARTGDPRAGALGAAIAISWAIAVTFPIVG
jgi:Serine aminopeptidase, S33